MKTIYIIFISILDKLNALFINLAYKNQCILNKTFLENKQYHYDCDKLLWITQNDIPKVLELNRHKYTKHCRHSPVPQISCNTLHCPSEINCILVNTAEGKTNWKCYETRLGKNNKLLNGSIYFESCYGNKDLSCINKGSYHFRQDGVRKPFKLGIYEWNNKIWNGIGPCVNNLKSTPCGCSKCSLNKIYYNPNTPNMYSSFIHFICRSILYGIIIIIFLFIMNNLCSEDILSGMFLGIGLCGILMCTSDYDESTSVFFTEDNCDD